MKNFSEATDIRSKLNLNLILELASPHEVTINQKSWHSGQLDLVLDLCEPIEIKLYAGSILPVTLLSIDGHDLANYHWTQQTDHWILAIHPTFYAWFHQVSAQGWIA